MKRQRPRGAIIAVLLLGVLIFGGVLFAWNTFTDIFQPVTPSSPGKTISIVIQNGETTTQIANDLQAKGLINSALAFRVWARIRGLDVHLQAGAYDHLNTSMTIDEIISQLLIGQPDRLAVPVPDGLRIEQFAARFTDAGLVKFNEQDFLKYTEHPNEFPDAAKYPILKSIPRGDSMEGLLYPDTYLVPVDDTARDVVNMMLTEFTNAIQQNQLDTLARANKLTTYQMVILASLIQREVASYEDAPGVASVYWNRTFRPNNETLGFLDADPTVQYALDSQSSPKQYWQPLDGNAKDTAPNSPWNTYTHKGLPPTPICSPSLAAMKAAASPAKTSYYYFLTRSDNGRAVFAKTLAEFEQDEQKYLRH
jgi:UPF0755 protein